MSMARIVMQSHKSHVVSGAEMYEEFGLGARTTNPDIYHSKTITSKMLQFHVSHANQAVLLEDRQITASCHALHKSDRVQMP